MLMVMNQTRNLALMDRGRLADNRWTRLRGLIGVRRLDTGEGLLIRPCKGVHCFFMSIPIDVVYVNDQDEVIALDEAMQPWRMGRIYWSARYVVELPAGAIAATGTQVGDRLQVTNGTVTGRP